MTIKKVLWLLKYILDWLFTLLVIPGGVSLLLYFVPSGPGWWVVLTLGAAITFWFWGFCLALFCESIDAHWYFPIGKEKFLAERKSQNVKHEGSDDKGLIYYYSLKQPINLRVNGRDDFPQIFLVFRETVIIDIDDQ